MDRELEKIFDRAIVGTKYNHPDYDIVATIKKGIYNYLMGNIENDSNRKKIFYNCFSSKHKLYGIQLRQPIYEYCSQNQVDPSFEFLNILFEFCQSNASNRIPALNNYYSQYIKINSPSSKNKGEQSKRIISELLPYFDEAVKTYVNSISDKYLYDFPSIENVNVSKSASQVLTNNNNYSILNSFSGSLLNGKISVASDRGYLNNPERKQEDSVLSLVKSEKCFLNVVADGAGGSANGAIASNSITSFLEQWFNSLDEMYLESLSVNQIEDMITNQLKYINDYIVSHYKNCYSTVVLALTVNDRTIIANVGDSTAYTYDEENDRLIEITTLDSLSKGMSYEEARHNPYNNRITQAIGMDDDFNVHFSSVDNAGERIILSSDGVTDLVSEETFKNFFRDKTDADSIVKKSVYYPDIDANIHKTKDNSSAIVIDLPNYQNNIHNIRR